MTKEMINVEEAFFMKMKRFVQAIFPIAGLSEYRITDNPLTYESTELKGEKEITITTTIKHEDTTETYKIETNQEIDEIGKFEMRSDDLENAFRLFQFLDLMKNSIFVVRLTETDNKGKHRYICRELQRIMRKRKSGTYPDFDFAFFPQCKDGHWVLMVYHRHPFQWTGGSRAFNIPAKTFVYYNSWGAPYSDLKEKFNEVITTIQTSAYKNLFESQTGLLIADVPIQDDTTSCGFFLLQFMKSILKGKRQFVVIPRDCAIARRALLVDLAVMKALTLEKTRSFKAVIELVKEETGSVVKEINSCIERIKDKVERCSIYILHGGNLRGIRTDLCDVHVIKGVSLKEWCLLDMPEDVNLVISNTENEQDSLLDNLSTVISIDTQVHINGSITYPEQPEENKSPLENSTFEMMHPSSFTIFQVSAGSLWDLAKNFEQSTGYYTDVFEHDGSKLDSSHFRGGAPIRVIPRPASKLYNNGLWLAKYTRKNPTLSKLHSLLNMGSPFLLLPPMLGNDAPPSDLPDQFLYDRKRKLGET